MRHVFATTTILVTAAFAVSALASSPPLEVAEGSFVTLSIGGAQRTIALQSLPLAPGTAGAELRSSATLDFPRIDLAFGEYVDIFQNQQLTIELDPGSGVASVEFPLWIIDSDGNGIELPIQLETGIPSGVDCSGYPFCFGGSGEPAHCEGSGWDPQTGEVSLVGVTLVPFGSGTTVDCTGIAFRINATISSDDADGDSIADAVDNCSAVASAPPVDLDGDGYGDVCDNCPTEPNPAQHDADGDGNGNACEPLRINYQPAAAPVPAGFMKDDGSPFAAGVGYGWLGGQAVATVDRDVLPDQLMDTLADSSTPREWEGVLPPGLWEISCAIGDPLYGQGPQRVTGEGTVLFDDVSTAAGVNLEAAVDDLAVTDGRLTLRIGGGGGHTTLNYVTAREEPEQPFVARFVNFQPNGSPQPLGFAIDAGAVWNESAGMGWDSDLTAMTRDRGLLGDPVLDTLIFTGVPRRWELALPSDYYRVSLTVGDVKWAQGPQKVTVEGQTWIEDVTTAAGELLELSEIVLVLDGALTVDVGQPGGNTAVTHVSVMSLPRDLDGDGVYNFNDNCVEDPNPDQLDSDGDGSGNPCSVDTDGDGLADPLDNCPEVANPAQADDDSDDFGNACDCAPADGTAWAMPEEIPLLLLTKAGATVATLGWSGLASQAGAGTVYDLVSGSLLTLQAEGSVAAASCLQDDFVATQTTDTRLPSAGEGFFYLVRGENACGQGTYGFEASGARAALDASGPCP